MFSRLQFSNKDTARKFNSLARDKTMGGTRVFTKKDKFKELVKLLKTDLTHTEIARYFEVDRTSVIHWSKKLGRNHAFHKKCRNCGASFDTTVYLQVFCSKPCSQKYYNTKNKVQSLAGRSEFRPLKDYYIENGERINVGSNYIDYLKRDKTIKKDTLEEILYRHRINKNK